jgi:hypothetical protein
MPDVPGFAFYPLDMTYLLLTSGSGGSCINEEVL